MPILGDFASFAETSTQDPFTLQNKKLLKVNLAYGPVKAARGAMVAYQGDAQFSAIGSGGMGKMFKKAVTGEGTKLMAVQGSGEVFFADNAYDIQLMYLDNDAVYVNGSNLLAFSANLEDDIKMIKTSGGISGMAAQASAGGLWNVQLRGTGYVAVTTDGPPVLLDVASAATFGDPNAVVGWSHGVSFSLKTDTGGSMMSMVRGSGETFQLAFSGQGWVMIQPSEGFYGVSAATR